MAILGNNSGVDNGSASFVSGSWAGRFVLGNGHAYFLAITCPSAVGFTSLAVETEPIAKLWSNTGALPNPKEWFKNTGTDVPNIYLTYGASGQMESISAYVKNNTNPPYATSLVVAVYEGGSGTSPYTADRIALSGSVTFPEISTYFWLTLPITGTINIGYPTNAITRVTGLEVDYKNKLINGGKSHFKMRVQLGGLVQLPGIDGLSGVDGVQPFDQNALRDPSTQFGGFPTFVDYINNIARQRAAAGLGPINDTIRDRSLERFPSTIFLPKPPPVPPGAIPPGGHEVFE